jgi:hypothetical protein
MLTRSQALRGQPEALRDRNQGLLRVIGGHAGTRGSHHSNEPMAYRGLNMVFPDSAQAFQRTAQALSPTAQAFSRIAQALQQPPPWQRFDSKAAAYVTHVESHVEVQQLGSKMMHTKSVRSSSFASQPSCKATPVVHGEWEHEPMSIVQLPPCV